MNHGFEYHEQIGPEADGQTVLAYLTHRYRHSDESAWLARIAHGEVVVDSAIAAASQPLVRGHWLTWRRPPWEEPIVPLAFAVLYRDEHLLAIAKPRGLPSVPNGGFLTHTLLHLVRRQYPEATPLHRLGRGTSGLVLFARTSAARRIVAAAWRDGGVEKTYRALITGIPEDESFSVRVPIGLIPHPRLGTVHAAVKAGEGQPSLTHARVLAVRDGHAIVEACIPTGRPHQIRIHMAAAGHPLVGDPLYVAGGGLASPPGLPGDPGYKLHAHRLRLTHPVSGALLGIECAPPPELQVESSAL
ncbi:MAG: pseudouridine synthase [Vicinamibacteria bacterium]|jgi:23S rRNA pseudouridine1911/1915/1917 synthase|nr:pseudouridine synthase [Vicinamibacteria bacterium]